MSDKWDYLPFTVRAAVAVCEEQIALIDEKYGSPTTTDFATASATLLDRPQLRTNEDFARYRRDWMAEREPWVRKIAQMTARFMPPIFIATGTKGAQKLDDFCDIVGRPRHGKSHNGANSTS